VQEPTIRPPPSNIPSAKDGVIEVHVRELHQLFDSLDPYPFNERDLDRVAEQYIVESVREIDAETPAALVVHLDRPPSVPEEERALGDSIRQHFSRKAQLTRRELRQLFRRGWISLAIGLGFLTLMLVASEYVEPVLGETPVARVLHETLVIGGWVAMWRPLEIFLYDWWPIVGARRVYDRLSQIPVRLIYTGHVHP